MADYFATAYGLRLCADADLAPLPALPPHPAEITIAFAGSPAWAEPDSAPVGQIGPIALYREVSGWALHYRLPAGHLACRIDGAGAAISLSWDDGFPPADVRPYLLGPVLGLALQIRGVPALHAAAVAIDGRALLLMGASGAGKSTTTAALIRAGAALIADDIAALTRRRTANGKGQKPENPSRSDVIHVQPGYPGLRVGAESLGLVAHLATGVSPLWSDPEADRARWYVNLWGTPYAQAGPAPVAALALLGPRRADLEAPEVQILPPREALVALMGNRYGQSASSLPQHQQVFATCARLAEQAPVYLVHAPDRLDRLGALAEALGALAGV